MSRALRRPLLLAAEGRQTSHHRAPPHPRLPLTGAGYPGFYVAGRTTVGWIVESRTADGTVEVVNR